MDSNMFCNADDLTSEAYVESLFCDRLFAYLGYDDGHIKRKDSLAELTIGGLRNVPQRLYRPDYAFKKRGRIRWILDAKSPLEDLEQHQWQPRAYSALINGEYRDSNPITHYCLSNGMRTLVFEVGYNDPILDMGFDEFVFGNEKLSKLEELLSWDSITADEGSESLDVAGEMILIARYSTAEVNSAFAWCHQHIYRKDNISQASAFIEFVKIIALKLESDKALKQQYPEIVGEQSIEVPISEVRFSRRWIEQQNGVANPVSSILFHEFMERMEVEIAYNERKRFFPAGDKIDLKPETIRGVVERLQGMYLFGIDADLNGRLFETFLSATMRGKDLGQFFTPRSIVKLGVRIADVKVHEFDEEGNIRTETVLDACCGTGGFLIDVFSDMNSKARNKASLNAEQLNGLLEEIKTQRIVGVDVGRDPNMAQLARLNMYLHGDGGTRVYYADVLDQTLPDPVNGDGELFHDLREMRDIFSMEEDGRTGVKSGRFDVVLTNPPFAKVYSRSEESEEAILRQYEIGMDQNGAARPSVKSSLLFFERYHGLLRKGGRLVSVIDDGILSSSDFGWFRDYLRSAFIVKAVISLPGDAFQRSKARVKTSLLVLQKRRSPEERQGPVFMYPCRFVGNDDPSRNRELAGDEAIRELAADEIESVSRLYRQYLQGDCPEAYLVQPGRIADRLDVKNCLYEPNRRRLQWEDDGLNLKLLEEVASQKSFTNEDTIISRCCDEVVEPVIVRYTGDINSGEPFSPRDTQAARYYRVHEGDIVISNIAASYGSVAVVPVELDGCVVTNEYTVLEAREGFDPRIIQALLRTPDIRAEILLNATGSNRTRSRWASLRNIVIPYPSDEMAQGISARIERIHLLEQELIAVKQGLSEDLVSSLGLADETSYGILDAFKPPK